MRRATLKTSRPLSKRGRGSWFRFAIVVCAFCSIGLAPAVGTAESLEEGLSDQAAEHYQNGRDAYENGKYTEAAEQLRKAYSLSPEPLLLYNLALAEWKGGDVEQARATALRASDEGLPDAIETRNSGRVAAFGRIATVRELVGDSEQRAKAERGAGGARGGGSRGRGRTPQRASRFGTPGWVGVGLLGAGAAGLGVAGWLDAEVSNAVNRARTQEARGNTDEAERIYNEEVEPKQTTGLVFLASGAALAVGGITMIVVDWTTGPSGERAGHRSETSEPAQVRPGVFFAPGGAGLQLQFRLP